MIPDEIIHQIEDIDLLRVLQDEGVELKRAGTRYVCCCPFHVEKTPSFSVTPSRNRAFCFGCHWGGGPIKFIQERHGMTFPEACRYL